MIVIGSKQENYKSIVFPRRRELIAEIRKSQQKMAVKL
jgi:hypothetical protein